MPITLSDYVVIGTIGAGGFGVCRKIRRKKDNKVMVWKEINYSSFDEREKEMVCDEVNALRKLNHPHILSCHGFTVDKAKATLYIVTDFCEGGDLLHLIRDHRVKKKQLAEEFIWKIFCQVTSALFECHEKGVGGKRILHRDIKPANVFLTASQDAILGDFGIIRMLNPNSKFAVTCCGTPIYMSPEILSNLPYNDRTDVWSLGCLMYEMCCLAPPFVPSKTHRLEDLVRKGTVTPIPSTYSKKLSDHLKKLLAVDYKLRPSVKTLVNDSSLAAMFKAYAKAGTGKRAPLAEKKQN